MKAFFLSYFLLVVVKINGSTEVVKNLPIYPFPYYSEVSPCPCDLTSQKCDVYCCCDKVSWFSNVIQG